MIEFSKHALLKSNLKILQNPDFHNLSMLISQ